MNKSARKSHPLFYTKEFGLIHEIEKEEQTSRRWTESDAFNLQRHLVDAVLGILGEVESRIERQLIMPQHETSFIRNLWPLVCGRIVLPLCSARLLLRSGYYSDTGGVLRTVAESLLLFIYFNKLPERFQLWLDGKEIKIGNVRDELGYEHDPLCIKYKELCGFIHTTERTIFKKTQDKPMQVR